ncbi:MAG: glycosyltransferase family 2 protein [Dehalococcoidia bacterium]
MKQPKISIILLNWNGFEDTAECLESLKKITYPNYEVIVVDNASSGDDVRILKAKYGDYIHVIANDQNYGYAEGNNIGMRYAIEKGTDYLLILNNDTVVDSEFLTELAKVAESDASIGIAGSKIYYYRRPNRIQAAGGKIIWWLGYIDIYGEEEDVGQYDDIAERDFVFGTSFLLKKAVIDKISFLDPYFFFGVEEYDYCTRAKRAGFKIVYVPQSKIWHKAGASRAKMPQYPETQEVIKKKMGPGYYKYYYRLYRTYCPPVLFILPLILQLSLVGTLLLLIWQGDWQRIKRGIAERLRFLFRVPSKSHLPH